MISHFLLFKFAGSCNFFKTSALSGQNTERRNTEHRNTKGTIHRRVKTPKSHDTNYTSSRQNIISYCCRVISCWLLFSRMCDEFGSVRVCYNHIVGVGFGMRGWLFMLRDGVVGVGWWCRWIRLHTSKEDVWVLSYGKRQTYVYGKWEYTNTRQKIRTLLEMWKQGKYDTSYIIKH